MARPRKEIDKKQFEYLCSILCTSEEIQGFFDISDSTLSRWCKREYEESFEEVYKKKSQTGKMSVRRHLFELSKKNAAACIFLAKNVLGYSDDGNRTTDGQTNTLLKSINEVLHEEIDELESKTEANH